MDIKSLKKSFIDVYGKTFGNVSQTCKKLEISRQSYYNWIQNDPKFAQAIKEVEPQEVFLDFIENKLVERINEGDTTAIIFALKTQGKKRGYVERQEVTGADGKELNINPIIWVNSNENK